MSGVSASYNLGDQLQSQGWLKQVQTPDHTIEYRHNALGNRVAKVKDGAVVERYLWQDKTTLLATYDGDGNAQTAFRVHAGPCPNKFHRERHYLLPADGPVG